jgi:hypothetical protein
MKDMRMRRRWWVAGLALAILAACVGVWQWSERPPYRFMEGARLHSVERNYVEHGEYELMFVSDRASSEVLADARTETGDGSWHRVTEGEDFWKLERSAVGPHCYIAGMTPKEVKQANIFAEGMEPPLPAGTRTLITISRAPSVGDRLRRWMQNLRWKRNSP